MAPPAFTFPPESYSAVYRNGGSSTSPQTAPGERAGAQAAAEPSSSPAPAGTSLLACFNCAFQNGKRVFRKTKPTLKTKLLGL